MRLLRNQLGCAYPASQARSHVFTLFVSQAAPQFTTLAITRNKQACRAIAGLAGLQLHLGQQARKLPMPLRAATPRIHLDDIFINRNDFTIVIVTHAQVQAKSKQPQFQTNERPDQPQASPSQNAAYDNTEGTHDNKEPLRIRHGQRSVGRNHQPSCWSTAADLTRHQLSPLPCSLWQSALFWQTLGRSARAFALHFAAPAVPA